MQEKNKIRLLIVDDSSFIRTALKNIVSTVEEIEVVGEAKNGKEAVLLAMELSPDIITMDVEMPVMSGIEATKEINKYAKIPIIMLSTLTSTGADATLDALTCGAVDFITKKSSLGEFKQLKDEIIDKIFEIYYSSGIKKIVHRSVLLKQNFEESKKEKSEVNFNKDYTLKVNDIKSRLLNAKSKSENLSSLNNVNTTKKSDVNYTDIQTRIANKLNAKQDLKQDSKQDPRQDSNNNTRNFSLSLSYEREDVTSSNAYLKPLYNNVKAIFIGISTGGPAALQKIIPSFSSKINVPIFIVQHMPPNFTKSLATRLNTVCKLNVKEAEHGEVVHPATIYIGKGGSQMLVNNKGLIQLEERKYPNNLFAPSVEVTLESLIDIYGGKILGIMMTGMGSDGKNAFIRLKQKGGFIVVQDFHSCIVAGMAKSVVDSGSANDVIKLEELPQYINSIFE